MKLVRLLRYMFLLAFLGPDHAQRSIAFLSFWNLQTNTDTAFIYSVTICEQKTEDCARSPLLTILKFSKQREIINLQLIQRRSQSPKYKFCKGKLTDCLLGIEMVQVSQNNDKRSIFAEYYPSETVLYLSDNMVLTPKHIYGGWELPPNWEVS